MTLRKRNTGQRKDQYFEYYLSPQKWSKQKITLDSDDSYDEPKLKKKSKKAKFRQPNPYSNSGSNNQVKRRA